MVTFLASPRSVAINGDVSRRAAAPAARSTTDLDQIGPLWTNVVQVRPTRQEIDDEIVERAAALFARYGFEETSVQRRCPARPWTRSGSRARSRRSRWTSSGSSSAPAPGATAQVVVQAQAGGTLTSGPAAAAGAHRSPGWSSCPAWSAPPTRSTPGRRRSPPTRPPPTARSPTRGAAGVTVEQQDALLGAVDDRPGLRADRRGPRRGAPGAAADVGGAGRAGRRRRRPAGAGPHLRLAGRWPG